MIRALTLVGLAVAAFVATFLVTRFWQDSSPPADQEPPPGMVWIPGGVITMGSNDPDVSPTEQPAHRVHVSWSALSPEPVFGGERWLSRSS